MLEIGDYRTRKQVTGKLLFQRTGENSYINFGDVRMHKHEATIERTKIMTARKGYLETTYEQPNHIENRWTVGLNEELTPLTRLDLLAGAHTDVTQASATAQSETFSAVKTGGALVLAKVDVSSVVVTVSSVTKTLGTDYTLDAKAGIVQLLRGGSIADGANVSVAYDCAQSKLFKHTNNGELTVAGNVRFDEYDQNSDLPRATYTFPAQIIMSNRGDNDGKKLSEFEVQMLVTGTITRIGREDS